MKRLVFLSLVAVTSAMLANAADNGSGKPDFYTYEKDGSVKTRAVYETDAAGRVVKCSVFDGKKKLMYVEISYYAPDGRLIRGDRLDSSGKMFQVIVFFDTFLKVLDRQGNVVDTQAYSPK
jgi:hypothetical protein